MPKLEIKLLNEVLENANEKLIADHNNTIVREGKQRAEAILTFTIALAMMQETGLLNEETCKNINEFAIVNAAKD